MDFWILWMDFMDLAVIGYNLEKGIADKFTKFRICFIVECFTADFCDFFSTAANICLLGIRLGTCHQIQAFQSFS